MVADRYDRSRLEADLGALVDLPIFVAYNANVDAIVRVGPDLEPYLDQPIEPGDASPPHPLSSRQDLATAITHTMATGRGDEVAMTDDLSAELEATLSPHAQQMGGQAGIMTNYLTAVGAAPITFTYLVSERQRSLFSHPNAVRFPFAAGDTVELVSLADLPPADHTKINWVFEFHRGDELFGVSAVDGTRFIAASRPPEFDLRTGDLDRLIDRVGPHVDGALLAGYHNLTPAHVDDGYAAVLDHARDVIRRLQSEATFPIHIESAVTHDRALRQAIYDRIFPAADVIGVDAHEVALLHRDAGFTVTDDEPTEVPPFDPEEILDHYAMLDALREDIGVGCIRLHAMQYHLAVMDQYLDPSAVERGLEFAAVNAATKATHGDITAPVDLETGLDVEPSAIGRASIERLADHLDEPVSDGHLVTPSVVACPNRVVDDPAGTVGIGDIVSASSFALEIAVANDEGNERR